MLFAGLASAIVRSAEMASAHSRSSGRRTEARSELIDLLDVLRDRARLEAQPIDPLGVVPIHSHATYALYEIVAAYGLVSSGMLLEIREGVTWAEVRTSDLFFVTLNKSDEDYSPTTRYQDYPISPTLFHWESAVADRGRLARSGSATSTTSRRGSRVILFVRENSATISARCQRHILPRTRPACEPRIRSANQIVWELDRPMPAEIYQRAKLRRGLSRVAVHVALGEDVVARAR